MKRYRVSVACSECTGDGFIEVERMPARSSYNDAPEPYCEPSLAIIAMVLAKLWLMMLTLKSK